MNQINSIFDVDFDRDLQFDLKVTFKSQKGQTFKISMEVY